MISCSQTLSPCIGLINRSLIRIIPLDDPFTVYLCAMDCTLNWACFMPSESMLSSSLEIPYSRKTFPRAVAATTPSCCHSHYSFRAVTATSSGVTSLEPGPTDDITPWYLRELMPFWLCIVWLVIHRLGHHFDIGDPTQFTYRITGHSLHRDLQIHPSSLNEVPLFILRSKSWFDALRVTMGSSLAQTKIVILVWHHLLSHRLIVSNITHACD